MTSPPEPHRVVIAVDAEGNVFAAGDCTDQPLEQGGIAAQQAETAAAAIAALVGAAAPPPPLRPTLRALLFTGEAPLRLGDAGGDEAPPEKIEARYLTPYLHAATPSLPTLAG